MSQLAISPCNALSGTKSDPPQVTSWSVPSCHGGLVEAPRVTMRVGCRVGSSSSRWWWHGGMCTRVHARSRSPTICPHDQEHEACGCATAARAAATCPPFLSCCGAASHAPCNRALLAGTEKHAPATTMLPSSPYAPVALRRSAAAWSGAHTARPELFATQHQPAPCAS